MVFYQIAGELMLGTRLRRLSERFLGDVSKIYKAENIDFEVSWFPVFYLLHLQGELRVSDLARELEITQSGASQMVTALEKKGLVQYHLDPNDKRSRSITLTKLGTNRLSQVKPIWKSIRACIVQLLKERDNSAGLLQSLDDLDLTIEEKGLLNRVKEDLDKRRLLDHLEIKPHSPEFNQEFRDLALLWLLENQHLDQELVNRPEDQDQAIFHLAVMDHQCVGATVVEKINDQLCRILLLMVTQDFKNIGVEEQLLEHIQSEYKEIEITIDRGQKDLARILQEFGFKLERMNQDPPGLRLRRKNSD